MHIGAFFNSFCQEFGADSGALRTFIEAADELGYDHLLLPDHILGADLSRHPGLAEHAKADYRDAFREPMVLCGYVAAIAPRLELVTHILVVPQRQAVLVAKQAAEIDLLTGGRFRLGVGLGWNDVEMEAMGANFRTRASRLEEQVEVLRSLWQEPLVDFEGRYHQLHGVGINPLPVQRPIPLWVGGWTEPAIKRACRIGDGIAAPAILDNDWEGTYEKIHGWVREFGRDPDSFGIENAIFLDAGTPDDWYRDAETFRSLGTTHLSIHTTALREPGGPKYGTVDDHIESLRQAKEVLGALIRT